MLKKTTKNKTKTQPPSYKQNYSVHDWTMVQLETYLKRMLSLDCYLYKPLP